MRFVLRGLEDLMASFVIPAHHRLARYGILFFEMRVLEYSWWGSGQFDGLSCVLAFLFDFLSYLYLYDVLMCKISFS